jgi:hypothetical protein
MDLPPQDNTVADGNVYATTYAYDGASSRITSISRSDGTAVSFTYTLDSGVYRVAESAAGPTTANANIGALTTTQTVTNTTNYNLNTGAVTPQGWSAAVPPPNVGIGFTVLSSAYDGAGDLFVAYQATNADSSTQFFGVIRYDAATQTWGTPFIVQGPWDGYFEPTVAADSAGNAAVARQLTIQ